MSIVEVSKAAGVSIATVSRVFNGHRYVSAATAEAVREAAERVGYRLPVGRGRAAGRPRGAGGTREADRLGAGLRTGTVAVLFPDARQEAVRTALSGRLLHGIETALRRRSLAMVVSGLPESGALPACVERAQVDGVIVRGTGQATDVDRLRRLTCVWVFEAGYRASLDKDMVTEDNPAIAGMAVSWLLGRGHRRLAFLGAMPEHPSFRVRGLFFRDEAERAGAAVVSVDRPAPAAELVAEAMDVSCPPTGLFVPGTDQHVVDVYRALEARGLKVGRDVDLISCNNDPTRLATLDPRLANIDIQPEAMGHAAVDVLLWRLRHPGEFRRRLTVPPALVEGADAPPFRGAVPCTAFQFGNMT